MLRRLGAVQLDTISVLAPLPTSSWPTPGSAPSPRGGRIEAGVLAPAPAGPGLRVLVALPPAWLPIEGMALLRVSAAVLCVPAAKRWHQSHRGNLRRGPGPAPGPKGPLTATQLGRGQRNGGRLVDWSDTKIAVEWLLDVGGRDLRAPGGAGRRVYDLPDRVLPGGLLADEPHRR